MLRLYLAPQPIVFNLSPNFASIDSRRINRDARKARLAPIVLANDTTSVPILRPKIAPPASVNIVAPGKDKAVVRMYRSI